MCFGFTKEQEIFRKTVTEFIETHIQTDADLRLNSGVFPKSIWKKIGDAGFLGIDLPEAYGGKPGDSVLRGIIAEELGRIDLSLAFTLVPSYGTALAILEGGSTEQKDKWLPGLISGDILGSVGMTEPDCGSDLSMIRTRAYEMGKRIVLNGEKNYVSWGLIADINWLFAKTEKDIGPRDMTGFLIPLSLPGIVKSSFPQMGFQTVGHASLCLDHVEIPAEYQLGRSGKALHLAGSVFPHTRMLLSLSALGLARATLMEMSDHLKKTRMSNGISALKIAEDATEIETARWLCYQTLGSLKKGASIQKEVSMCKWWSTKVALQTIHHALCLFSETGSQFPYSMEQRYRDIIGFEIAEATPQILKLNICEALLGKKLRPLQ